MPPLPKIREASQAEENHRRGFTPSEFSGFFGRHPTWAYRLLYSGQLKKIAYSGRILIPLSELDRFTSNATAHE